MKGPATNNRGEIQAATMAIRVAGENGIENLKIITDSMFLYTSVNKWMEIWRNRNWTKLSDGRPLKNALDFQYLDRAMHKFNTMNITFKHVKAHSGCKGNEQADRLAQIGAKKYRRK